LERKEEMERPMKKYLVWEVNDEPAVKLILDSLKYLGIFCAQADGKPEGVEVKVAPRTS